LTRRSPPGIHLSLGAFAALSLYGVLTYYWRVDDANRRDPDPYRVEFQVGRVAPVREALPPGARLGYLSDLPFSDVRGSAMFFAAQYGLAPHPVQLEFKPNEVDFVLGYFAAVPDLAKIQAEHSLQLVREFGPGVALFRRAGS